jgi:selenophosphate synthetase-related protein
LSDLAQLADAIRNAPGLRAKRDLSLVASKLPAVDGEDAALIAYEGEYLVLGGEAIAPALIEGDPYTAGAAAVVTNVADIRAMGGRPLALIDTLVSPDEEHAARTLDGLAWAADLLGVEVPGGHLTIGGPPALSAFCTGVARKPLRASAARPGDDLIAAFCTEGRYRSEAPFFSSLRDRSPEQLRDDGEALVQVALQSLCHAARDVSMPGVAGSLLQMLELAGCGATLDLDRLPRPANTPLERWLVTFPSFGFVLAASPRTSKDACAVFTDKGIEAAVCGSFDDTHHLRIEQGGRQATVWDLEQEPLTALGG